MNLLWIKEIQGQNNRNSYLLLCNKLPPNLVDWENKIYYLSFCGSGIWAEKLSQG